jgi:23S rRNA (guanosine2251-2'-O)-methyltransferase
VGGVAYAQPIPGRRTVQTALEAGRTADAMLVDRNLSQDPAVAALMAKARSQGVNVQWARAERLTEMAGTARHQGVLLMAHPRPPVGIPDLLALAKSRNEDPFIICVDGVEDPQNVGALARSAFLAGAHGLVLPERGAASLGPGALRASAGALGLLGVAHVPSLAPALGQLKREGVWLLGADADGGKAPWDLRLGGPLALILGSEHEGLSSAVLKGLDEKVCIPTPGGELSLNVAAAAAALCFERVRQTRTR